MNEHPDIPRFATPKWNTKIIEQREAYMKRKAMLDNHSEKVKENQKDDEEENS